MYKFFFSTVRQKEKLTPEPMQQFWQGFVVDCICRIAILAIITEDYQEFVKDMDERYKIKMFIKPTRWSRAHSAI